jgi:hypothetical protein
MKVGALPLTALKPKLAVGFAPDWSPVLVPLDVPLCRARVPRESSVLSWEVVKTSTLPVPAVLRPRIEAVGTVSSVVSACVPV